MENDLKGNKNYFELTGGSSYRGFELPRVDCIKVASLIAKNFSSLNNGNDNDDDDDDDNKNFISVFPREYLVLPTLFRL